LAIAPPVIKATKAEIATVTKKPMRVGQATFRKKNQSEELVGALVTECKIPTLDAFVKRLREEGYL